jgi:5'-deoxynucleotidase YfbR-like HD superfamily hydrolase
MTAERQRAWQRMLSGRRLDLVDPSPLDIEIADIAHGLARVARWNGQTIGSEIFSVAQHSLLVEALVGGLAPHAPRAWRLAALLHDAPEYVIGDMISPFKAVLGSGYRAIEMRLPPQPPQELTGLIKTADRAAAYLEATRLAGFSTAEAKRLFDPPRLGAKGLERYLAPLGPALAEEGFLRRFAELDEDAR